jgi:hypothetical protein
MTDADSAQPSKEQNRNHSEDRPPEATAAITAKVARISAAASDLIQRAHCAAPSDVEM